jgi:Tfp pilus assembly PilM family ATPase
MAKKSDVSGTLIEIGSDWLKMAQFSPSRGGVSISRLSLQKLDSASTDVSKLIADAAKQQKFGHGRVMASIPRQAVTIRMLELPSTDPNEIEDMVDFQAGKQTPYSKDEIVFDYKSVGSSRSGYTRVMLAIVQRSVLRQHFNILENAGVHVNKMSVSSEGLLNWCRRAVSGGGGTGATVLLDVDSTYTDCIIVGGGSPLFTRSILVGANDLLNDFEAVKDKFVQDVRSSLEVFWGEYADMKVTQIIVTGAGINIKGLPAFVGEQLGIKTEGRDCQKNLKSMPKSPSLTDPQYQTASITSIVGMAMSPEELDFNMVPDSVRLRRLLISKAKGLAALGMLVMTVLVFSSMYMTTRIFMRSEKLKVLKAYIEQTDEQANEVKNMQGVVRAAMARQDAGLAAVNLMVAVNPSVPEGMYFDSMSLDIRKSKMLLSGYCLGRPDILKLVNQLEASPLFANVSQPAAAKKKGKRILFKVSCDLEKKNDT